MTLEINEIQKGMIIEIGNLPYKVLDLKHLHLGRGGAILQTKLKNLIEGNVIEKNFKPSDEIEEVEIEKIKLKFIYSHRGNFVFQKIDSHQRFNLKEDLIGDKKNYLGPNLEIEGYLFKEKLIEISLPPKVDLKVIEAPPGIKGNTKQGGTKTVILETGKKINVPLFIKTGDIIRVNTERGEYVERVKTS